MTPLVSCDLEYDFSRKCSQVVKYQSVVIVRFNCNSFATLFILWCWLFHMTQHTLAYFASITLQMERPPLKVKKGVFCLRLLCLSTCQDWVLSNACNVVMLRCGGFVCITNGCSHACLSSIVVFKLGGDKEREKWKTCESLLAIEAQLAVEDCPDLRAILIYLISNLNWRLSAFNPPTLDPKPSPFWIEKLHCQISWFHFGFQCFAVISIHWHKDCVIERMIINTKSWLIFCS